MDAKKTDSVETLGEALCRRWFDGIKAGTLRMSQIKHIPFFTEMLRISHELEEFEISKKIQDRIDELNCKHPDHYVINTNGYRLLCVYCGKNIN